MVKEIPKTLKIIWLIQFVVCLIFSFIYVVLLESYTSASGYPYLDPIRGRAVGLTTGILGIFAIRAIMIDDWEKIQIYVEFSLFWIISIVILNVLALFMLYLGTAVSGSIMIIAILVGFFIPNLYYYLQLRE